MSQFLSGLILDDWRGSLTAFQGFYNTKPEIELPNATWGSISDYIAPDTPKCLIEKKDGVYVLPCLLKDAPLTGKTLENAKKSGQPTVGKQRSKSHVLPAKWLIMDVDDIDAPLFAQSVKKLENDGLTYTAFTTFSHGKNDDDGIRARILIPVDREMSPEEYRCAWNGFDTYYFNGAAGLHDGTGQNIYQQQGIRCLHPDRIEKAWIKSSKAGVASASGLILQYEQHFSRIQSTVQAMGSTVIAPSVFLETPENKAKVTSALGLLSADCTYSEWRRILWALASTGWADAEEIARSWSMSAPDRFSEECFNKTWGSFDPTKGTTLGSLFYLAKQGANAVLPPSISNVPSDEKTSGDIKNGSRFASMYRDRLLYVHETGDWLEFKEAAGWLKAKPGEEQRAAKLVIAALRAEAAEQWKEAPDAPQTKRLMAHVEKSSTAHRINAMLELAKSEDGMTVQLCNLDASPFLLGVQNGVLNLESESLLQPSPTLMVTKRCRVPYIPSAKSPTLVKFIRRITKGDPALAKFLQRLAGYLLTGEVSEQCFAFLYGLGRNGKTTYAELLFWFMGDYSVILPTATLTASSRDPSAASPDLMLLKGARLALASELEESSRFAEATLKSLTGGDTLTARNPYGKFSSWVPSHKLLIVGNHRPVITGTDHGIWRRVRLVPFSQVISDKECDNKLLEKLRAEGSGVLNWALEGLREWKKQGLNPPASVKDAGASYRDDMDIFKEWMSDHTVTSPNADIETVTLYRAYFHWAKQAGWSRPLTRNAFGRRLTERGITTKKNSSGKKYAVGLLLNKDGLAAACIYT